MKVNLTEEKNKLVVEVTIKKRVYARDKNTIVETRNVLDYLTENGYSIAEWKIVQRDLCSTNGKNQKLNGTWVLEKKSRNEKPTSTESPKQQRTTTRRTRKQSTKKDQLLRTENLGGVQSQAQTDLSGQDQEISGE